MSEEYIYGVNLNTSITPIMVRDALVECFSRAHCADAGLDCNDFNLVKKYCTELVYEAFIKTGGDFNNPTKDSIFKLLGQLAEFSKNFRDPLIIKEHYNEIMKLAERLQ